MSRFLYITTTIPNPIPTPIETIVHTAIKPGRLALAPLVPLTPAPPLPPLLDAATALALANASKPAVTVKLAYSIWLLASVVVLPTNPNPEMDELPVQMAWLAEVPPKRAQVRVAPPALSMLRPEGTGLVVGESVGLCGVLVVGELEEGMGGRDGDGWTYCPSLSGW